jgi:putative iron-dependent peroxidase
MPLARYCVYSLADKDADPRDGLRALPEALSEGRALLGLGAPVCAALGKPIDGLRTFPALSGAAVSVASTQGALLVAAYGDDRGKLLHRSRAVDDALGESFVVDEVCDTFVYGESQDLTGYEDGTENPEGAAAARAALVRGRGDGLDGGSFVAVQRWIHDLDGFFDQSPRQRDFTIGRSRRTNEELDEAPESAHVKRAAQESFDPEAFMVRRSMPFATEDDEGLLFVAFGDSLDRYERVLRRMLGLEDGIVDGLFGFTRPTTGGYYFCPPLDEAGRVRLSVVGL